MGLLLVNLCLCSWEKSYIALTLYKKRNFQANPRFYEKARHGTAFKWHGSPDQLTNQFKKRYSVVANQDRKFYLQKGLFGRTGATIIHIGLLWTMAAGFYRILADDFGWGVYDATVILPEGQSNDLYVTRKDRLKEPSGGNLLSKRMPFNLRAVDFNAEYFPHSTVAKGFASLVELIDGGHRQIYEVTMENPILYKGYKITQNSFSPNDRIQRGKFRVTDLTTGNYSEIDTVANDPVKIRGLGASELFIQVADLKPGSAHHIVDLKSGEIREQGTVLDQEDLPLPIDTTPFAGELSQSRYSLMVAALFPNFILDENQQPTTRDETFTNPAVMLMFFKNGRANGYTWQFLNPEAQKIVGHPHPELEVNFVQYRKKDGATTSSNTLYDYEVELAIKEKADGHNVGNVWLSAGQLKELSVNSRLLETANIRMDRVEKNHSDNPVADADTSLTILSRVEDTSASQVEDASTTPTTGNRYQVEFLGMTSGHVTFLGFMKDPSVAWIFIGCIIIIFGTLIAFLIVYREVWCYYDEDTKLLYMATAVRGTSPRAHREFDRLVAYIKSLDNSPQ